MLCYVMLCSLPTCIQLYAVVAGHSRTIRVENSKPVGPGTQYLKTLVLNTITGMVFGTRVFD